MGIENSAFHNGAAHVSPRGACPIAAENDPACLEGGLRSHGMSRHDTGTMRAIQGRPWCGVTTSFIGNAAIMVTTVIVVTMTRKIQLDDRIILELLADLR
jgi:hypothetical protein